MGAYEISFYGLTIGSAGCAAAGVYPVVARLWNRSASRVARYQQAKVSRASKALDDLFVEVRPAWLTAVLSVGPLAAAFAVFLVSNHLMATGLTFVGGLVLPDLWVRGLRAMRVRRFRAQLVDALFILSSSLRAGLSLTQAFEELESELGPPASQEFGLMLKAHRLGRPLEEALALLNARLPCDELQLMTTSMLVARETGGDVTGIISQLITTIRERKKLSEKVKTLTLQARLQAYIMSVLPLLFATFIRAVNPQYFNTLLEDSVGRFILVLAAVLWLVGMALLLKMSRVEA